MYKMTDKQTNQMSDSIIQQGGAATWEKEDDPIIIDPIAEVIKDIEKILMFNEEEYKWRKNNPEKMKELLKKLDM